MRQAAHRRRAAPGRRACRPPARLPARRRRRIHQPGPAAGDHRRDPRHRAEEQEGESARYARLVGALGPELSILRDVPLDEIGRVGGSLIGEAITRLRRGEVIRDAGYDGEYGTIRLFQPDELNGDAAVRDRTAPAPPRRRGKQS